MFNKIDLKKNFFLITDQPKNCLSNPMSFNPPPRISNFFRLTPHLARRSLANPVYKYLAIIEKCRHIQNKSIIKLFFIDMPFTSIKSFHYLL